MKKINLTIAAAFITLASGSGQAHDIEQSTIMISGDTSFDNSSADIKLNGITETSDTTTLSLAGAYFIAKNIGVGLMINNEDTDIDDGTTQSNSAMNMIGPIISYNISLDTDFSVMLTAGYFNLSGDYDDGAGNGASIDGDGVLLMATVAYFIADNFAVNLSMRKTDANVDVTLFNSNSTSGDMEETTMTIGLSAFF